ncbi:miraculin-like [Lotus japonicus]|uniref:miraculin-like n=1 Tax=Lotus japonicus TaxID=34305 RepID=UPI00258A1A34|nr:miraculin-like [Lotus japonicus]
MKITFLALVLLFALSTKASRLEAAGPTPKEVFDTSGKKLRAGAQYYIVPASPDVGGGLGLNRTRKACPLDAVAVDGNRGLPLVFTPVNPKKGVVRVDTDLNIYFATETSCPQSNVWKVDYFDSATEQLFVTTGGVLGDPGLETIRNWFKIETYEDAYKLNYCPSVCYGCYHQCLDIGIYEDQYGKRLVVDDFPFKVRFQLT